MHGESGLKKEEMPAFWRGIYQVMKEHGPNVIFDARIKDSDVGRVLAREPVRVGRLKCLHLSFVNNQGSFSHEVFCRYRVGADNRSFMALLLEASRARTRHEPLFWGVVKTVQWSPEVTEAQ